MKVEFASRKVNVCAREVHRVSYHEGSEATGDILHCHLRGQAPSGSLVCAILVSLLPIPSPFTPDLVELHYRQEGQMRHAPPPTSIEPGLKQNFEEYTREEFEASTRFQRVLAIT